MRPHHRRRQVRADQQQQQQQRADQISTQTFKIITQYGDMLVVRQGVQQHHHQHHHHHHSHHHPATTSGSTAPTTGTGSDQQQQQQQQQQPTTRPIIMTFHDLGLNSELQFANFCDSDEVKLMLQTFTLIHVNFIGQEFQVGGQLADSLPDDYKYPTVEQMAECVVDICAQLRVRSFVALAVGAGAHIVGSLALLRPDLVHGLFLINPVISSCSLTEWLCFKMSAIAGNQQLIGSHGGHAHGQEAGDGSPGGSSSRHSSFRSGATDDSDHPHQHHSGGLRKLWNAVHHHHHHATGSGGNKSPELNSTETETSAASESSTAATPREKPASNRLRQLILSRNFRSGAGAKQPEGGDKHPVAASHRRRPSVTNSIDTQLDSLQKQSKSKADATSGPEGTRRRFSGGTGSDSSTPSSPTGRSSKRPPIEYLMYHHFGSASFQRVRRPSLQTGGANEVEPVGSSTKRSSCDSSGSGHSAAPLQQHRDSRGSTDDEGTHGPHRGGVGSASDSPAHRQQQQQQRRQIARSLSICLSPQHLASISSDRRRANYMQTIYKQYFTQINAHNLWLFAQSFVKRRSLNLRKDCGAAAHAAAAAAALSTSICAAFVGMAPAPASSSATPDASRRAGPESTAEHPSSGANASAGAPANLQQNASSSSTNASSNQQQQQQQQALVAGTKVKRTFTCQTLIMCSSVQIHCERALKLMALLNPLQATWIKTDQLLVLEEKPEKVCQALRLFLQGLGYSMSTYERRLRLSSAQASFSSADSNGSARSLSDVVTAATTTTTTTSTRT